MRQLISCAPSMLARRLLVGAAVAIGTASLLQAQIPGRNVNMVSGRTLPDGDPYLQRQNEPSIAASTRNPLHLLAGANDYRTVDLPGIPNSNETGDAWMGVFKSYDGGNTWRSTLIPGYPQDAASTSPLKAYKAAADPVVRAGTNGLFYYSGIVFDRATPAKSAMFVSRFIDNNNQEAGDPIVFMDTKIIISNPGTAFIDKPWFAVDIPRANAQTCTMSTTQKSPTAGDPDRMISTTQSFPGGAAYAAFSLITGEGTDTRSQIYLSRSTDCGATWSAPQQISSALDPINQGATLAIDPRDGSLFLAWRRFTADGTDDSIMVTRSMDQGRKWDPPGRARRFPRGNKVGLSPEIHGKKFKRPVELADLASLDQNTKEDQFRTNAYPTMAIDGSGRVYVAWSERGYAPLRSSPDDGDARILIASSSNGAAWTEPSPVDNSDPDGYIVGHQVMPTLTFAGGKLMIAYYDFRKDVSGVFGKFVDEFIDPNSTYASGQKRHTVDVRAAMALPAANPTFGASVRVSEYLMGSRPGLGPRPVEQLQFNPPNLKLFKLGTVPFVGDYIDLTSSPAFVPASTGGWTYNTAPASSPLFHVAWTDNRDVVPPANGNWSSYTPPGALGGTSTYDGVTPVQACVPGREGMRNQNIYTARITGGLVAGSPGNTKPLSPTLQRAFVIFAQNATQQVRTFRMTIENQPVGGRASFLQDPLPPYTSASPAPLTILQVIVPARSTVARNVYATSTEPHAQLQVTVKEIAALDGAVLATGMQSTVILNPDISNPDISNPDISNPDISNPDISNAEVSNPDISNPDISNPDISNPDISNPDISNPDISNPDISNVQVANPDISNPDISNPDISNPDISNPDISNPDISNPDISNQSLTDTTWTITNDGNTAASYSVKLLLNGTQPAPNQILLQLILRKVYTTPVAVNCTLALHAHNVLLANIIHPDFATQAEVNSPPDIANPDISNATLWLAPGETAKITLRVMDKDLTDGVTFNAEERVTPAILSQALNTSLVDGQLVVAAQVAIAYPPNFTVGPQEWALAAGGNGNFYEYVRQGSLSWTDAATLAAQRTHNGIPGRLVTITSAAENQFVNDLRAGGPMRAWIGLYDPDGSEPGPYRWLSGEAVTYTNWVAGEPNNPATEFWVEMFSDGGWNNNVILDPIYPTAGYVVEYVPVAPAPGVSGPLTFNSFTTVVGSWTQNVAQAFELTVDMTNKTTSLSINGATVANATFTATTLSTVGVQLGTTGTQRFGWDDIVVRNDAGTVTVFNADFTGNVLNQPPTSPAVGTWAIANLNGSVLVRSSSGNLVARPVEIAQFGGTNSVSLNGTLSTAPTTGVWRISWTSVMADPGAGATGSRFAPIVVSGSGGFIATIEYR